ncbi:30S ribosomal protein S12 methylthiotransferase RimO [Vicingus serpentipes]|uniref:Ribosomal protein uS12 methylthiotransferase RimO n=1 Tax=Vicingus serpentipes TaxID=1926625 RepID=A0A5C6RTH1_9FLAO|nr:30S ribosomal protein S12 methylthiotransferase RimO [Vicingus serpentipes]TXB65244.1 30S ribosomal protein S12 methylthiotransferase RimO [Vicingus serpentipes]
MKTKTLKNNKVNVITLGCSKNLFDSEVTMTQLKANGYEVEHEAQQDDSEIVIINTCGFIDNAKEESINTILRYAEAKKDGQVDKLYVTGCLSERYKEGLEDEIKEVDAFFGTRELPKLLKTLKADYKHELVGERIITTPSHYAFLKISEGCDRKCAFCAIPLMRGKHISTPIEELVLQAKNLAKQGVKELILIAQELTFYGLDIYGERRLPLLLQELSKVEGVEWIRLHYAYPTGFPMEIIEEMKVNPKVCNYLDIPLQHASNNMLKAMKRGATREKTTKLINDIRVLIPEIAIRTTFIVGFPGETREDIEEMKEWIAEMQFERLGVFTYSHEEDTTAYDLIDDVSEKDKQDRAQEVMDFQQGISLSLNEQKIGKTFKVLFDRVEGDYFVGRTEYDSPEVDNEVLVSTKDNFVRIGDFANVTITGASDFDLYGEVVNE